MTCPSCNTANRDDAKFCKKCGQSFRTEPAEAAVSLASQSASTKQENAGNAGTVGSGGGGEVGSDYNISLAPTQIITPQQMMALHNQRWQAEQAPNAPSVEDEADMPTLLSSSSAPDQAPQSPQPSKTPSGADEGFKEGSGVVNGSGVPAGGQTQASHTDDDDFIPIPPPPPPSAPLAAGVVEAQETQDAPAEESPSDQPDADAPPVVAPSSSSHDPYQQDEGIPATANDFPTLAVGTTVIGRYEITQIVSADEQEHLYLVTDHEGYQRCWNCASEQNREGDEFCIDCGARLADASYNMHEYPATESNSADASVLHETIINTFVDNGRTYVVAQTQVAEEAFPNGVHLVFASDSDAGDIRRADPNEDSTLTLTLQRIHESHSSPVGVFIVADGMGGHDNGQGASRLAISTIADRMVRELLGAPLAAEASGDKPEQLDENGLVSLLQGAIEDANAAICRVNQRDKTDMGSTITGFMTVGDYTYILNVGDSRTYMVRGGQIYQLTNDHSLVGQLVAGGLIQPDDVYTHPQRSQIFRSLGDKLNVQVDIFKQQLHPGDILLACCDGLWEMVRNPQIESILNNAPNPQIACSQLIEAANKNGGEDNISAVVVFVH